MSEDIEGIEREVEIELGRISVSSFGTDDPEPDTEVSEEALSDSETVSIQWAEHSVYPASAQWAKTAPFDEWTFPQHTEPEAVIWAVVLVVLLNEKCSRTIREMDISILLEKITPGDFVF